MDESMVERVARAMIDAHGEHEALTGAEYISMARAAIREQAAELTDALQDIFPLKEEILEAITVGVTNAMPTKDEILFALADGVSLPLFGQDLVKAIVDAIPFASEITTAIYQGCRDAIKDQA